MQRYQRLLIANIISLMLFVIIPASAEEVHTALDKFQWTYDTDPYGSEAIINEKLIRHGGIWIKFKRVARINKDRNTWAELIYKIPSASLADIQKIRLTYQSEIALIVSLPQTEYGKNGDKSYAYYQAEIPATKQWRTEEINLKDFKRPYWTPAESKDQALIPAHIKTINLAPHLSDNKGGEAIIQVRAIELLP